MKNRVISKIQHRTPSGTDVTVRFMATQYNREFFEAEIPTLFEGVRGVARKLMCDRVTGDTKDCLTGTFLRNGKKEPFGIALTPDLLAWYEANMDAWRTEETARRNAEIKVWYTNRHTWDHVYLIVDGRLTDDGIIAGLPESVLDETTEEQFREGLAAARQKKAAVDKAKADRDAKFQAALAEAQRTGKPVKLDSFMADCDGSVEDCSTDYVVRSVWPDGKVREERTHTY